jgi:CubicO group peptidase (beta-lactamase class C family)
MKGPMPESNTNKTTPPSLLLLMIMLSALFTNNDQLLLIGTPELKTASVSSAIKQINHSNNINGAETSNPLVPQSNNLTTDLKLFKETWQNTEKQLIQGIKLNKIIGSSFIFMKKGEIIAKSFYGYADRASGRKIDENTIFHWASITKTLTGIAIMQLRDRGLLRLNDPVVNYIPELNQVYNPFCGMEKITIRHLMSHSSGFRNPTWPWGGDKSWHPYEPKNWQQVVAMFPYTEILFKPGSMYSYSNLGIIFLGRIIEKISGDDYEVYIDKNILKPLKMYHSYFDITPYHLLKNRSNSYFIKDDVIIENGLDFDTGITVSNGGLNAPVTDMVKYLAWLTNCHGKNPDILKHGSLEEMWEPQISSVEDMPFPQETGLIFFLFNHKSIRLVGHRGDQMGFISFISFHPGTKTAAISVFNSNDVVESGRSKTKRFSIEFQDIITRNLWPACIKENPN